MKIGMSALIFNMEEALKICEENKEINHIEIGIDNLSDCDKLKIYKDKINDLNLSVGIHLPMELNPCEDIVYIRDSWVKFVKEISFRLNYLKVEYYNMHLGYVMSNRLIKDIEKYLSHAVDFFDKLDLPLTMENTYTAGGDFTNVGTSLEDFNFIFKSTKNKNLEFCYDTGHDLICKSNYFLLKNKFKVVHLSDNKGKKDEHLGIGYGILDKETIEKILQRKPEFLVFEMQLDYIVNSINIFRKNYNK